MSESDGHHDDADSASNEPPDEAAEVRAVGAALDRLLADDSALPELEESLHTGDVDAFRGVLDRVGVRDQLEVVCRWLCSWHVQRRCFWVCRDLPMEPISIEDARTGTIAFGKLAAEKGMLDRMLDAIDSGDDEAFREILDRFELGRFCRIVCVLVLSVRCELFCGLVHEHDSDQPRDDHLTVLRELAGATARLAEDEDSFTTAVEAYMKGDIDVVREVLDRAQLFRYCQLFCWWFCVWVPYLRCTRVCLPFGEIDLEQIPQPGDPGPIRDWAKVVVSIAQDDDRLRLLLDPVRELDDERFSQAIRELELVQWCHFLCFWLYRLVCHRYCFLLCPPRPPLPYFFKLGGYDYTSQVDAAGPGGTGLTLGDNRAFFATVRLNGSQLQKEYDGGSPEYRFEVFLPGAADWTPVLASEIVPTDIGSFTQVGLITPKRYVVNGSGGPDEITVPVAADGWIAVPTANNYWGAEGYFSSTGNMINLDTTRLVTWPVHDAATVDAGEAVPASELGADQIIGVRMKWRRIGDAGDGVVTGTAARVAMINDRWNQVAKNGKWIPHRVDGQLAVVSVDVDELGAGCEDITDQLHVAYTAGHPNLGAVGLTLTGPGGNTLTMANDASATTTNVFGAAEITPPKTAADLVPCSYIVTLSANLLLTTGDSVPDPIYDVVAFHKS